MTEDEKRKHRCCFTGHRPEKLIWSEEEITKWLEEAILQAVDDGYTTFISGMARGVDIWAAEIVLKLRDAGRPIKLICAIPYDGFDNKWSDHWRKRYKRIVNEADYVKVVCEGYSIGCFQVRNEWMVDCSSRVLAVYNGQPSGTRNTVIYANSVNVPVVFFRKL